MSGWDSGSLGTGGDNGKLPYEYDEKELKELADLMPPPLEARPFPSSRIEIKRLLDKHGVRSDATFGTDFEEQIKEQEAEERASRGGWEQTLQSFDEMWSGEGAMGEDEEDSQWTEESIPEEEARLIRATEFGYECMKEKELKDIYDKAMELHFKQRERSRNIYATCMWYAKKLEAAEVQNNQELEDKNPIPTFIRAMYTLEEEFDDLNKKQYDVELKMQEHSRKLEDAEYREFLRSTVITLPTKPGDDLYELLAKPEEDTKTEEPEIDIDIYLHGLKTLTETAVTFGGAVGTLPNAAADQGYVAPKEPSRDAHLNELLFKEDNVD